MMSGEYPIITLCGSMRFYERTYGFPGETYIGGQHCY